MALTPDSVKANLDMIQKKVRRLTRSLSGSQLSTTELNNYINTFVLYDFPEHLRLFNLQKTFSFYTEPYVDIYETSSNTNDPLYDFKNRYLSVHQPFYIAGKPANFYQSRQEFYAAWPFYSSLEAISSTGDGAKTSFSGTLPRSQGTSSNTTIILRNQVTFSSKDSNGAGLTLIDYPISNTQGYFTEPTDVPTSSALGSINYRTGAFTVNFTSPPGSGEAIQAQYRVEEPTLPFSVLFFDGKFVLRPVPDKVYKVQCEVFVRPTELLGTSDSPDLKEWWQYIAYGAAKKVFEDRMDTESIQQIMPEFKTQEMLIERRTIVQQTSQRTPTIYTDQFGPNGLGGYGWWGSGSGPF